MCVLANMYVTHSCIEFFAKWGEMCPLKNEMINSYN